MSDEGLFRIALLMLVLWGHCGTVVALLTRMEWRRQDLGLDEGATLTVEAVTEVPSVASLPMGPPYLSRLPQRKGME